ncbi:type II secretion system protein [Chamaesiphon sp. OTE_8_metabat_110]|uniref:type IV pilus modification PilV family protein n=1 Tax=Chamaesiphon sp. OTE_8_metabat_110 TaxID=2964696 RepID=UPI00286B14BC|nr:type II secretion system protein [Chamaesiphon sp. OTE_8_metabat_110]
MKLIYLFMNLKLYDKKACESSNTEAGFSLIETVIALTTLGVCLAYAMPLFLYAKVNNSKSEIRTGALIVSQRVFDKIRSESIADLPSNDGVANASPPINPKSLPVETAMGRPYQTTVTYCEGVSTDSTVCSDKYRKFKVEVSYNGTKVYDLEGTYTQFE